MNEYQLKECNIHKMDCQSIEEKWILETHDKKFVINIDVKNFILKYNNSYINEAELDETGKQIFILLKKAGCFSNDSVTLKNKDYARLIFKKKLFTQRSLKHLKIFKCLFSKLAFVLVTPLIVVNIIYSCFIHNINNSDQNLFLTLILLTLSGVFHEIGHISASIKFGFVPKWAGIGIYFTSIIFFVDVDDTWKLPQKQRLVVDMGGIYFQLMIASLYFVVYLVFNQAIFLYVSSLIAIASLFNLNPFLKYDGYWILSDILGVYNLNQYLAISVKTLLCNVFTKRKINNFNYKKSKVYAIGIYAIVSELFYIYFAYVLIKCSTHGLWMIFYKFSWYNLFINIIFLFFALCSLRALYLMLKNIFLVKVN